MGDLGQLPPPPLVNGLQPGPGHTASARPAQPVSTPVSKPVSRHTEEHKQQALARPERTQHHAEGSQRAQKSAGSTQPAPAQQAPAEPSAAQPALPERQPLGTWPEVSPVTGNGKGTSAARSMPAAEAVNPIHSPLGPPVSGKSRLLSLLNPPFLSCGQLLAQRSPAACLLSRNASVEDKICHRSEQPPAVLQVIFMLRPGLWHVCQLRCTA